MTSVRRRRWFSVCAALALLLAPPLSALAAAPMGDSPAAHVGHGDGSSHGELAASAPVDDGVCDAGQFCHGQCCGHCFTFTAMFMPASKPVRGVQAPIVAVLHAELFPFAQDRPPRSL